MPSEQSSLPLPQYLRTTDNVENPNKATSAPMILFFIGIILTFAGVGLFLVRRSRAQQDEAEEDILDILDELDDELDAYDFEIPQQVVVANKSPSHSKGRSDDDNESKRSRRKGERKKDKRQQEASSYLDEEVDEETGSMWGAPEVDDMYDRDSKHSHRMKDDDTEYYSSKTNKRSNRVRDSQSISSRGNSQSVSSIMEDDSDYLERSMSSRSKRRSNKVRDDKIVSSRIDDDFEQPDKSKSSRSKKKKKSSKVKDYQSVTSSLADTEFGPPEEVKMSNKMKKRSNKAKDNQSVISSLGADTDSYYLENNYLENSFSSRTKKRSSNVKHRSFEKDDDDSEYYEKKKSSRKKKRSNKAKHAPTDSTSKEDVDSVIHSSSNSDSSDSYPKPQEDDGTSVAASIMSGFGGLSTVYHQHDDDDESAAGSVSIMSRFGGQSIASFLQEGGDGKSVAGTVFSRFGELSTMFEESVSAGSGGSSGTESHDKVETVWSGRDSVAPTVDTSTYNNRSPTVDTSKYNNRSGFKRKIKMPWRRQLPTVESEDSPYEDGTVDADTSTLQGYGGANLSLQESSSYSMDDDSRANSLASM